MYRNILSASLLFALLGTGPAFKFLEFGAIATDNLQLFEEQEELVFNVSPSVELAFEGNRFDADVLASLDLYNFAERGDTIVDPRLFIDTEGSVIDNLLFLNASLDIGQLLQGEDFFDLTEDSDTQGRIIVNPFIARKFGRFADLFAGYSYQGLDNELDGTFDTQQDTFSFSLGRDPKLGGFIWGVGADFEQDRTDGLTFDSSSGYGAIGSTFGQSFFWQLQLQNGDGDSGSELLEASVTWTPNERTRLKVGYNDRFFGGGPILTFAQRLRSSTISASWTRPTDVTDLNDEIIASNELFVDERFRIGYKLAGRRSDLTIDAIFSNQEEILGDATNDRFVSRIAFDRHLSPLTTVRFQYEYLNEELDGFDREDENRLGVRFIYNFDRKNRDSIIAEDVDDIE